jgi:hypothetical protein
MSGAVHVGHRRIRSGVEAGIGGRVGHPGIAGRVGGG